MTVDELAQKHLTWWSTRDSQEDSLYMKALEYDDKYFKDFQLETTTPDMKEFFIYVSEEGAELDCFGEIHDELYLDLESNHYTYHIQSLEDCNGMCNMSDHSITIDPTHIEDKAVILHEMIHAHEDILNNSLGGYPFVKEILLLYLYNKVKPQVKDLDKKIVYHANMLEGMEVQRVGGSHDILFYLKSLDLDIQCGYSLGTVCGYGRDEY